MNVILAQKQRDEGMPVRQIARRHHVTPNNVYRVTQPPKNRGGNLPQPLTLNGHIPISEVLAGLRSQMIQIQHAIESLESLENSSRG